MSRSARWSTNTTPIGAVRGAGRPEATQALERAIDAVRRRLRARSGGGPPSELHPPRRVPVSRPWPAPATTSATTGGRSTACSRPPATTSSAADQARAPEQRLAAPAGHRPERSYVEITNGINETEFGAVEITGDGDAIVKTGSFSHGQGHETTFAQIASDRLGLPIEKITVVKGDTDAVARGTGTYGSKSTQIGGAAAGQASEEVVEQAKRLAAEELEASPEDMVLDLDPRRLPRRRARPSRP